MSLAGRIIDWNDKRGTGFIATSGSKWQAGKGARS